MDNIGDGRFQKHKQCLSVQYGSVAQCFLLPLHWYLCILFGWPQHSLLEESIFFCMHILISFEMGGRSMRASSILFCVMGYAGWGERWVSGAHKREFVKDWAAQEKKAFAGRISIRAITEVTDGRFDDISAPKAEAALWQWWSSWRWFRSCGDTTKGVGRWWGRGGNWLGCISEPAVTLGA